MKLNAMSGIAIGMIAAVLGAAAPAMAGGPDRDGRDGGDGEHAVFVMSNDAQVNEVLAFERGRDGTLRGPRHFRTGGRGSGGHADPLASQGSLTLSTD